MTEENREHTQNQDSKIFQYPELVCRYRSSMVKICVLTDKVDHEIGAGFHIGDGYLATARHVVDKKKSIKVLTERVARGSLREKNAPEGQSIEVQQVFMLSDEKVDVAVLKTDFTLRELRYFPVVGENGGVYEMPDHVSIAKACDAIIRDSQPALQSVMVLGYPPIPRCPAPVMVSVKADINAVIDRWDTPFVHWILSSIPRGGFSGGPVIDQLGRAIGIFTDSLNTTANVESGFSAAISIDPLLQILFDNSIYPGETGKWMRVHIRIVLCRAIASYAAGKSHGLVPAIRI